MLYYYQNGVIVEKNKTRLAEYIWIDGTKPTSLIRSKTKVIGAEGEPPVWGFDGSSTKQAEGTNSDCILMPVLTTPDPFRGYDNILVLCEVWTTNDSAHDTNTRVNCRKTLEKYTEHEPWVGIEQEYTLMKPDGKPIGWPESGLDPAPQGDYYCGIGPTRAFGRQIAEEHMAACLAAGIIINGINAEVCPGQWE